MGSLRGRCSPAAGNRRGGVRTASSLAGSARPKALSMAGRSPTSRGQGFGMEFAFVNSSMDNIGLESKETAPGSSEERSPFEQTLGLARRLARTGEPLRALELAGEALELARRNHAPRPIAEAAEVVADAHLAVSSYPDALALYLEALALWQGLGNPPAQVRCIRGAADVDMHVGDYARSLGRFEEALALLEEHPDHDARA